MKFLLSLLILMIFNCSNREKCYELYAGDTPYGLCSKELNARILLEIQDPNAPIYQVYSQDPNGYILATLAMCKLVEDRKKRCDSRHFF
jgi:hypothetical protein